MSTTSTNFFTKLSQNYVEILEGGEYYDIKVEVGEDSSVKIFHAHKTILCYRSPYLRQALASDKKDVDNVLAHIKLPNMSPDIFQIILGYIYGGVLSLNEQNTSDILEVLAAADVLLLQELIEHLQKYLIENKSEWMEQHFEITHQTSFRSNNLLELQQFCTNLMANSPEKVFNSFDFTSLPENSLIQLIKRDDLRMKKIEVWEHVLEWGLAQNQTLISDPDTWTNDDFKTMENTLQHCLPLIRFFDLSSKEFLNKVRPYKKLLKRQLYEDLLKYYLDPDSKSNNNVADDLYNTKLEVVQNYIRNIQNDLENQMIIFKELRLQIETKDSTIHQQQCNMISNDQFESLQKTFLQTKSELDVTKDELQSTKSELESKLQLPDNSFLENLKAELCSVNAQLHDAKKEKERNERSIFELISQVDNLTRDNEQLHQLDNKNAKYRKQIEQKNIQVVRENEQLRERIARRF